MAHPKRKSRKQEEMRRTHYKATVEFATCPLGGTFIPQTYMRGKCTTEDKLL
jgi:ribosomal protein L32